MTFNGPLGLFLALFEDIRSIEYNLNFTGVRLVRQLSTPGPDI